MAIVSRTPDKMTPDPGKDSETPDPAVQGTGLNAAPGRLVRHVLGWPHVGRDLVGGDLARFSRPSRACP